MKDVSNRHEAQPAVAAPSYALSPDQQHQRFNLTLQGRALQLNTLLLPTLTQNSQGLLLMMPYADTNSITSAVDASTNAPSAITRAPAIGATWGKGWTPPPPLISS